MLVKIWDKIGGGWNFVDPYLVSTGDAKTVKVRYVNESGESLSERIRKDDHPPHSAEFVHLSRVAQNGDGRGERGQNGDADGKNIQIATAEKKIVRALLFTPDEAEDDTNACADDQHEAKDKVVGQLKHVTMAHVWSPREIFFSKSNQKPSKILNDFVQNLLRPKIHLLMARL